MNSRSKSPVISSLTDLYNVGTFVSITEFRDLGSVIEVMKWILLFYPVSSSLQMVLMAHRRIQLVEAINKERPKGRKRTTGVEKVEYSNLGCAHPTL